MRLPEQLPTLKGPVYAIYRVAGAVLILVALLSSTLGMYLGESEAGRVAHTYYGAGLRSANAAIGEIRPFGPEAVRVGVRSGRLVAIDGVDVRGEEARSAKVATLLGGPEGSRVEVAIAGRDGVTRSHTLTRSARYLADAYAGTGITFGLRKTITMILYALTSLIALLVCLLLYLRRPRDPVAALLVIGITGLNFSYVREILPVIPLWAIPSITVATGIFFFAGMLAFPAGKLRPRWPIAAFGVTTVLGVMTLVVSAEASPLFAASVVPTMLLITAAVLYRRFVTLPAGVERQQMKWAALGVAGLTFCLILQTGIDVYRDGALHEGVRAWLILASVALNSVGGVLFSGGLLIALLRYRLYDAEAAISRSAALAVLTLVLLAVFAASEKVIEALGEQYLGGSLGPLAGGIGAALAAVAIAPLHHRMTHWAEHRFQKAVVRLRSGLPALVGDLRETASVAAIGDAVLARIEAGVRSKHAALLLDDATLVVRGLSIDAVADWRRGWIAPDAATAQCDRDDPFFPMRVPLSADGCGRVGWLLLGPRPDNSFYGKDEREVLIDVADPIARALAIASARAASAAAAATEAQGLKARVASLEATVGRLLRREDGAAPLRIAGEA